MAQTPPLIIYHHGLLFGGEPPKFLTNGACIMANQICQMVDSGLWDAASEIHFCLNGGAESEAVAKAIIPAKAHITYHGLASFNENLTIMALWERARQIQGKAYFLYVHQKSTSHDPNSDYGKFSAGWRDGMMADLVANWRTCVRDLETHDVACSHCMRGVADGTQNICAGNFWWATSNFLATVPSMFLRERIKQDGIGALSSRYEAEVWLLNGRVPEVKEYRPAGGSGVP